MMNKLLILTLSGLITGNLSAMERSEIKELGKPKSCCSDLTKKSVRSLDRFFITTSGAECSFEPAADKIAKKLFKRAGILGTLKLADFPNALELLKVAHKAGLNGLTIFASDYQEEGLSTDAITGKSFNECMNGKIFHAILVPKYVMDMEDPDKKSTIFTGVVEREITRIKEAYTENDPQIITLKRAATQSSVIMATLLTAWWDPSSLLITIPANSIQWRLVQLFSKVADKDHELSLDEKALELSGQAKNLMATIIHYPGNVKSADKITKDAQYALENLKVPSELCDVGYRLYSLMKAEEKLKIQEAVKALKAQKALEEEKLKNEETFVEDNAQKLKDN